MAKNDNQNNFKPAVLGQEVRVYDYSNSGVESTTTITPNGFSHVQKQAERPTVEQSR